ncbi:family 78 glycoside hydrolase catalytic domain [Demequina sp. SYSU T00068]|uniref:alpha-L-rhamnosidase n=1 Tax=Demequina lignilytica TaxID=3051663 RepID=UPI00260C4586|nr:alpha-L-rhamnosidase [Demequina sp. SYSU T00068]MDN4490238.1 family 78 glycoside hydrolase catalytic domain [Demequina sp. SYSU T00068]
MPTATNVSVLLESGTFGEIVMTRTPRLSWATATDAADWEQDGAEVEWDSTGGALIRELAGPAAAAVAWPFSPLATGQRGTVRVRVHSKATGWSPWSAPVPVRCGVADGWSAAWIAHPGARAEQCPVRLRQAVSVRPKLRSALLYATAHGVYQASVDGIPVDDERMKPGWTHYGDRDTYACTDVTALLTEGTHAVAVDLAAGWYAEKFGFNGLERYIYGSQPAFSAVLRLEYKDGTVEEVVTDGTWDVTDEGPILSSGIYAGEQVDARRREPGGWVPAAASPVTRVPVPRTSPPVRVTEELSPVEVIRTPGGATVLDFGQNLVGRLRISVDGPAGTTVTLRHAEVLQHGELALRPLRRATAIDRYTLAGGGPETWEPQFTFHGFRYAQVDGWPGELDPSDVTALVIHSDMRRTGAFESSHGLLDRLHENVVWSMRGNFLSIPTDCPQRDERLGWTGDIQVFAPTASFLHDSDAFLSSWLEDLALDQTSDGSVPFVVPDVLESAAIGTAAWGDASTLVPWTLYQRFGDLDTLARQFPSMRRWVDWMASRTGENLLWEDDFQFADWLDPTAPPDRPADAKADKDLVATAHLFRSADVVAQAAGVLGDDAAAQHYGDLAARVREAWLRQYVTASGRLMSDAQTAYAVAIGFGIVDDERRDAMGARLAELVERAGYRISTGFVGTPLIADALTDTGHADVAGRLLLNDENPSWLYPVTMGATTIWERWDSMLEDGSVNPGEMTSFNHYALGAIADFLHRRVAGLAPAAPGYREVEVRPLALDGLDRARATFESAYGTHEAGWERVGEGVRLRVVVPPNTRATVHVPGADAPVTVGSGTHEWVAPATVRTGGTASFSVDTPLVEIRRSDVAYGAVREALIAMLGREGASDLLRTLEWGPRGTFRMQALLLPPGVVDAVDRALAAV